MLELPLEIFSAQKTYLKKKNIRFSVFPVSAHLQVVSTKAVEPDLQGSFISFHAGSHLAAIYINFVNERKLIELELIDIVVVFR